MTNSNRVVVLGMKRSGTSLTAGILASLGYFVENNSREPDRHNPEGYWESYRVLNLNTRLLRRLGGTEFQPPRTTAGWEMRREFRGERKRAKSIVESYETHDSWAMKDDRFSLTLPLWKLVLPPRLSYVICVRNPLAVARSMAQMDRRQDWESSFKSWYTTYFNNAILNTQGEDRLLVFYEDYRDSSKSQILKLCDFLGKRFSTELESRFKPELSHQQPSLEEFLDSKQAIGETKDLYLSLLATKSGSITLDQIGESLKETARQSVRSLKPE